MKFCPICKTHYDEEILRFCTKDGTPLVDENPSFTALPSESSVDDTAEETVIRRNPPSNVLPPPQPVFESPATTSANAQRIIIPMNQAEREPLPPILTKAKPPKQPAKKSNAALVILLTMFGTLAVLAILGGVWYALRNRQETTVSSNTNSDANTNRTLENSSSNTDFNADNLLFNANLNTNVNANFNAVSNVNLKTPTPTRTPTPKPSVTPAGANVNSIFNTSPSGNTNSLPNPLNTPLPLPTPRNTQTPVPPPASPPPVAQPPQNVNVGVMNSRAISLPKPAYPQNARQVNASGQVTVQISVDEEGNVISARAVSGHPFLRAPAENSARQSRFNPVKVGDRAVRATGILVYNFINQ